MSKIKIKGIVHKHDIDLIVMSRGNGPLGYIERPDIHTDSTIVAQRCIDMAKSNIVGIGGLEPFDTAKQTWQLCRDLRKVTEKPIHIFTHYSKDECIELHNRAVYWRPITTKYKNIIITYGDSFTESYNEE